MAVMDSIASEPMGRKRVEKPVGRDTSIILRCAPAFKAWVETFAESERYSAAILLEQALVALAKERKYPPPPRR
jgi:hypothetical protein